MMLHNTARKAVDNVPRVTIIEMIVRLTHHSHTHIMIIHRNVDRFVKDVNAMFLHFVHGML